MRDRANDAPRSIHGDLNPHKFLYLEAVRACPRAGGKQRLVMLVDLGEERLGDVHVLNLTCNSSLKYLTCNTLSTVKPENPGQKWMAPVFHDSDTSRVDFVRKTSSTSITSSMGATISYVYFYDHSYSCSITYCRFSLWYWTMMMVKKKTHH